MTDIFNVTFIQVKYCIWLRFCPEYTTHCGIASDEDENEDKDVAQSLRNPFCHGSHVSLQQLETRPTLVAWKTTTKSNILF